MRGVGNQFQKTSVDSYKSDREMTVCEMQQAQDRARREHEMARAEFKKRLAILKAEKAKLSQDVLSTQTDAPWDIGLGRLYCNALALFAPKKAHAQGVSSTPRLSEKAASSTAKSGSVKQPQVVRPQPTPPPPPASPG